MALRRLRSLLESWELPVFISTKTTSFPSRRRQECARLRAGLPKLSTGRELHLERRALAQGRFDPNTPTVHLHDLLGDGEPEAGASLGLSVGTVDLMELVKD